MKQLEELIAETKDFSPSAQQKEEQRRSFAYGNTKIENALITRETIDKEAEALNAVSK